MVDSFNRSEMQIHLETKPYLNKSIYVLWRGCGNQQSRLRTLKATEFTKLDIVLTLYTYDHNEIEDF